jgi:hypothetical protein
VQKVLEQEISKRFLSQLKENKPKEVHYKNKSSRKKLLFL